MSGRGRAPGTTLQRLAEAVLSRRVLDPVLLPALADLQHEHALVADASLARRARVLVRGYAGFWIALAQCLATWPPAVRLPTPGRGSMRQDLAYGLRVLGRQKAWSALAVLALALGIGSATTIFSVIQNVLLDPFPYTNTTAWSRSRSGTRSTAPRRPHIFQTPEFLDYQAQIQVFEDVIAGGYEDVLYATGEGTEQFERRAGVRQQVQFLGVPAALGPHVHARRRQARRAAGVRDGPQDVDGALRRRPGSSAGASCSTACRPRWSGSCRRASPSRRPTSTGRSCSTAPTPRAPALLHLQARLKPGVTLAQAEADIGVIAQAHGEAVPETTRRSSRSRS